MPIGFENINISDATESFAYLYPKPIAIAKGASIGIPFGLIPRCLKRSTCVFSPGKLRGEHTSADKVRFIEKAETIPRDFLHCLKERNVVLNVRFCVLVKLPILNFMESPSPRCEQLTQPAHADIEAMELEHGLKFS